MLTPRQCADRSPVGYHSILRRIRSGELPAVQVGGRYGVREEDFQAWLDAHVVNPAESPVADLLPPTRRSRRPAARPRSFTARAKALRADRDAEEDES